MSIIRMEREDIIDHDDITVSNSKVEYNADKSLNYLLYELLVKDANGKKVKLYKVVKLIRTIRLPKAAKQEINFMAKHSELLSGCWERGINVITVIANILTPVALGLLHCYGVQAVSEDLDTAIKMAEDDMEALELALQGNYRTLEYKILDSDEAEWLRDKMSQMKNLSMLRGIPQAKNAPGEAGQGFGGKNRNPDTFETTEEIVSGLADKEYVILMVSSPIQEEVISKWLTACSKANTKWQSQMQGSTGMNFGLNIPMMFAGNLGSSQGWSEGESSSENYGHSLSHSDGTSFSESFGESHSVSDGISSGWSHSHSLGSSLGTGTSEGTGTSTSFSDSTGISQGINSGVSYGISHNDGVSYGTSHGTSSSVSDGTSTSHSVSNGTSYSTGTSSSSSGGYSSGYSHNDGTSSGTSDGNGKNFGYGWSHAEGSSNSQTGSASTGSTDTFGANIKLPEVGGVSFSHGDNGTITAGASEGYTDTHTNSGSYGTNYSHGTSNGTSSSDGYSSSSSYGWSNGSSTSYGVSSSESYGTGTSHTVSNGVSDSVSHGTSSSDGYSYGTSFGSSYGTSESSSTGGGTSTSQGTSTSAGTSESESYGTSGSTSHSVSNGTSHSISNGRSSSDSSGVSWGNSAGTSSGFSAAMSSGTSASMGIGASLGISKSYQFIDVEVRNLVQIYEQQNARLMDAMNGQGAFFVDLYIATPDDKVRAAATTLAKSAWQNENALFCPLQVVDLEGEELKHMLYHFAAFSSCNSMEGIKGSIQGYKYSTVLLSSELTAYTHPIRLSAGGQYADIEDVPILSIPSMMKGEIYLGKIISGERWTRSTGYKTRFDYRLDGAHNMHHIFFTGESRSGKTVLATRFVVETALKTKRNGKRMRIIVLDPKQDWRILGKFIDPERFRFYSLGDPEFLPIKFNLLRIPQNVRPQIYADGIIENFCRSYQLGEKVKPILRDAIYKAYEEAGCFGPDWKETASERSKGVSFPGIYLSIKAKMEMLKGMKATASIIEAYERLLDRLDMFSKPYTVEYQLFGQGGDVGLSIDQILGEDDIVVLESYGLDPTFKFFVFGAITTAIWNYCYAHEGGFGADDQYSTLLVIEEANEVLIGGDNTSGGIQGTSQFEKIIDQAAGLELFICAITQKIADMPQSIVANTGLAFSMKISREDDKKVFMNKIGKDEKIDDKALLKFLPKMPTGWCIAKAGRTFDFKDAEPVLVAVDKLDCDAPTNKELLEIMENREVMLKLKNNNIIS